MHLFCDYLTQARVALESSDFDALAKLTTDLDAAQLELQSAIQNELMNTHDISGLCDEVSNLIELAQCQKQELAKTMRLVKERKKSIAAYVRNK